MTIMQLRRSSPLHEIPYSTCSAPQPRPPLFLEVYNPFPLISTPPAALLAQTIMFLETRDQLAALQGSGQVFEIPTINASDITYDRESEKWLHKRIGRDTRNSATFTRFPDLPTEIRLNIWRFALRAPRTIMMILKMRKSKEENEQRDRDKEMQRLCIEHMGQSAVDSAKPPALLGVCRESREIALK